MNETQTLVSLHVIDYIIIGVILVSTLISLVRGFVKEFISLAIWAMGFWMAIKFYHVFALILEPYISNAAIRDISSFVGILIVVLILGVLFNYLFSFIIIKSGLSGTDRLLGMLFGLTRGILLVAVILLIISTTSFVQETWWKHSVLIPHFQFLIDWFKGFLPEQITGMTTSVTSAI